MTRNEREAGQSLVEFSLVISVFLLLLIGTVDLARVVYQYNGAAEAAREIARVTSVHPGSTLGDSAETQATVTVQQRLVPLLVVTGFSCIDIAGTSVSGTCQEGDWVRVSVRSTFYPSMPLLQGLGPFVMTSTSSAKIE